MDHFPHHPPNGHRILKPDGPVHPGQAQPAKGPLLGFGSVDPASHQGHFDHLSFHVSLPTFIYWTQVGADKNGSKNRHAWNFLYRFCVYLRSSASHQKPPT
jgi:hypothetical protein